jgi:hypothetical protein
MGFRIEHEQALLNRLIYRERHLQEYFGAASWSMRSNDLAFPAWSFCVCPGGILVNSSTTEQGMVVNGMSFSGRGGSYINGALVSPISPSAKASPLEILEIQESFEEKSASFAPGEQRAPAQEARDFLQDQPSQKLRRCTFRPGVVSANLSTIYPTKVIASLRGCIKQFDQRFEGFSDGILVGAETRTSSPVRIVRGDNGQSVSHEGLYPCGEGAGYAGGILTSALDGVTAYLNFLKLDPIGVPGTNHFKESPIE